MNKKGYTLIELLATIIILGLLSSLAIGAYGIYIKNSRDKSLEVLAKSSITAFKSYIIDNPGIENVTLDELVELEYLENNLDPANGNNKCRGTVSQEEKKEEKPLESNIYTVIMCCANSNYKFIYDEGDLTKEKGITPKEEQDYCNK